MEFKPMRRSERELAKDEAISLLEKAEYGVLSLASTENGYPYGVPINYVYDDNNLYFHCGENGQKLDMLKEKDKACFTVVSDAKLLRQKFSTAYKSVIAFGRCTTVYGDLKDEILLKFGLHFAGDLPEKTKKHIEKCGAVTAVVKFEIDYVTGKQRKDR